RSAIYELVLPDRRDRPKAIQPVAQAEQWVFPKHARACIAHDDFDLFAAIALVAVNGAFGAGWFFDAKPAALQAEAGVIQQGLAFGTEAVVVSIATVDANHSRDGLEFAREAFMGKVRRWGMWLAEGRNCLSIRHTGFIERFGSQSRRRPVSRPKMIDQPV